MNRKSKLQFLKERPTGIGMAIGVAIGLAVGVALKNIPVGLAVGAAMGPSLDQKRQPRDSTNHH